MVKDILDGLKKKFPGYEIVIGRGDRLIVDGEIVKGILLYEGMRSVLSITEEINSIALIIKEFHIKTSISGYSCPICEVSCSDKSFISKTDAEFIIEPEPHYSWDETHKCTKCDTVYLIHNGT